MAESSLFAAGPHQPIDVMLLVENSHQMSNIWDDLRNRYLSTLMSKLQLATSEPITASVTVWVLESQSTTLPRSYSDPYAAINDVHLSYETENRISAAKVDEAAVFLQSLRAEDQSRSLHLIVVAASTPLLDATDFSPWYSLAEKLGQANIHCHLLMRTTSEDMTALTTLFEETLRSQSNLEDLVSFPVDADFAVRLSMSPAPGQFNPPPRPQRIPMPPRRNTFPLEAGSQFDHEQQQQYHLQLQQQQLVQQQQLLAQQSAQPPDGSPSLVSHLQQVHGLTKKKVYGAKPVRKPFFKDEPYYDRPDLPLPQHAAPLKGHAYSHDGTLPPSSGRAMTHSKADRLARLAHTNPTDPQGRQYGTTAWARRIGGSRLASPEIADATLPTGSFSDLSSPPTSYLSSNLSSPVSPVSMDYGASVVNGGSPDPSWLQPAYVASGPVYAAGIPQPPHSAPPTQQGYYVPPPPGPPVHGMYHQEYAPIQVPQGMPGPGMVVRSNASPSNAAMSPPPTIPPPPGAVTATSGKTITPPPRSGASSVSSIPGTSNATTAATSTTTTPRSAKKQKPNRPEDDEYIELDPKFVQIQTDLFNEMFPNAEKVHEGKVKAASEASSGSGVGKVGVPAAGVGGGAGVSGTGSSTSKSPAGTSLRKAPGRPPPGSTTTSSPASASSSKVAGGSKSPSTATSSTKSKTRSSKSGSISKKAKRSGATASPSTPPSTVKSATSAQSTPNTSSAPIPTSLPSGSTSAASTVPASPSGLSTSMTTTAATMGASDSGLSGNSTGVGLGPDVPVAVGGLQESVGSQVYGIGLVGTVLDTTVAKPRVSHGAGHVAATALQPLMYATPPQGAPGSSLGYAGAPPQGGVQAGLQQQHYAYQYQQHPPQIQTHQLHHPAYLHSAPPSQLQSPVSSPVLDNAGRYQHMAMPPPQHPSTHQMGVASVQYDDGSEAGGYYPATHYSTSLGDSMAGGGPLTPNSLAGWAGSV